MRHRILALALVIVGCTSDASRSPACGLAIIAGPTLIQQQLSNARAVIPEPPRGLPDTLPAVVIQQRPGKVIVGYDATHRIVLGYQGSGFPAQGYGLLVLDDTSQRVMGVLVFEQPEPKDYPKLGVIAAGSAVLNLYGVRVDWANVSNPRCPLFGPPPAAPAS